MGCETGDCGYKQPVLIQIVEAVKPPQPFIPTLVRFERFKDFYSCLPQAIYLSAKLGRRKLIGILPNRKADSPLKGIDVCLLEDSLIDQVIQGRPEVLESVPCHQGKLNRNFLDAFDVVRSLLSLQIVAMCDGAYIFFEGLEAGVEIADMLIGPIYL
jgi:hypothetical protein